MLPEMRCPTTLIRKTRACSAFLLSISVLCCGSSTLGIIKGFCFWKKCFSILPPHAISCWQCLFQFLSVKTACHTLISNFSICQKCNKDVHLKKKIMNFLLKRFIALLCFMSFSHSLTHLCSVLPSEMSVNI